VAPPRPPAARTRRHRQRWLAAGLFGFLLFLFAPFGAAAGAQPVAPADDGLASVTGTLNNGGVRLADATVRAVDGSGRVVATTESDEQGKWQLTIPPGTYTFEVVEDTLPESVSVQAPVQREVLAGKANIVIFSFGEARSGSSIPLWERVIRLLIDGLRLGMVLAICAIGASLIFGTTGLTNFAHGELVTLGAVAAWILNVKAGIQLIPATILAVLIGVGLGLGFNAGVWKPMRKRRSGMIAAIVVSIGLALVFRYLILMLFSDRNEAFKDYQGQVEHDWGPFSITSVNLATIVISLVALVAVALLLQKTRIGKAMRAVSDNRDLASSSGINVERVIMFVWGLAGGLAALGGVLFGLSELGGRVNWEMGFRLLLLMLAGITLGGLGTAYGALIGCVIVGVVVQLSTLFLDPDLKYVAGLAILIIILVVRPQGIMGSRERIG
jgi:branched-chain amino acid transport system permease protein